MCKLSDVKGGIVPAEPQQEPKQQQESTEIRITVKKEEDETLSGERNTDMKQSGVVGLHSYAP